MKKIFFVFVLSLFILVDGATIYEIKKDSLQLEFQEEDLQVKEVEREEKLQIKEVEREEDLQVKEVKIEEKSVSDDIEDESEEEPQKMLKEVIPMELECNLDKELLKEISQYKDIVHEIIEYVVNGPFKGKTFDMLAQLTDTFGSRMTGSKSLEDSIDWMLNKFHEQEMDNIHTEPVEAPHWVRNNESLFLMEPRMLKLDLLGLGSSVATPPGGITAEALVVESFDDLDINKEKVKGRIVIFNPSWEGYGPTVSYRVHAASKAVKYGALATLVRSITPFSINSPHTGMQKYDDPLNKIPTACITTEDAEMLHRMQQRGDKLVLKLEMGAENFPNVTTRNSVADILGYEKPDEYVVVSAHLDSWDVGVGAMDDGGGVMISWSAPTIMKLLGLRPRRTVRTILFTAEEQGLYGGKKYFDIHSDEAEKYQLILESDIGTFNPMGISFSGSNESQCIMKEIVQLLEPIDATQLSTPMRGGPDIHFWKKVGVPIGSVLNDESKYFWFHHSDGDRMDVEDSPTLDRCAALWTAVSYVAADISVKLPIN